MGWHIRRMDEEDLAEILAIESMSFARPWSRNAFKKELTKEYSESLVVVNNGSIVGYSIVWIIVDEIHIANIAVHPGWRRRGIGAMLLEHILEGREGFSSVTLEVRRSNLAARSLYEKYGFHQIGIRKDYYTLEEEDAVLMAKSLLYGVNEGETDGLV